MHDTAAENAYKQFAPGPLALAHAHLPLLFDRHDTIKTGLVDLSDSGRPDGREDLIGSQTSPGRERRGVDRFYLNQRIEPVLRATWRMLGVDRCNLPAARSS
jgi:hypothetical protein